jgi:release factor glutamine methyltransferase
MLMPSVSERIAEARRTLVSAGLPPDDAAIDAEVLARHALGWDRATLVVNGRATPPDGFDSQYAALVERRARREPVAFITGHREFWGLDFEVSPDVLIPRPETELIVEAVIAARPTRSAVRRIVDVGTGSGCLAIALAIEYPDARAIAIDISRKALDVARRNAARHGVLDRIQFLQADLLEAIAGHADVIVANPPYVPSGVALSPDIVRYEPPVALYSGTDGLSALERLIHDTRAYLADGGLFVVEFGLGQDHQIEALAHDAGWRGVMTRADLQGIPRIATMINITERSHA